MRHFIPSSYLRNLNQSIPDGLGIRLMTSVPNDSSNPVHVTLQYLHRSSHWSIPNVVEKDHSFETYKVEQTLCLLRNDPKPVFDIVATSNLEPVEISLKWKYVSNYFVQLDKIYTVSVPNGSPGLFYVDLTDKIGYWNITVESEDINHCGMVSIHPLSCPVSEYNSSYQSMFKLGVLHINAKDYQSITNEKGFFLRLQAFATNCPCNPAGRQFIHYLNKLDLGIKNSSS